MSSSAATASMLSNFLILDKLKLTDSLLNNLDLDMIANIIAKDNLFHKSNQSIGGGESSSNDHQIFNHSIHGSKNALKKHSISSITGTPQSKRSSPGKKGNKSPSKRATIHSPKNYTLAEMHTVQHSNQMHHLHHPQQQQPAPQQGANGQPNQQQQPQTSQQQHPQQQQQAPPPQHQQQQQQQGSGIFHGMYQNPVDLSGFLHFKDPGFDMSNIFQMSQINGHLQGVPQMTISFANGGAPTMVSHIPAHIQVPLPPPSTSTVVVNGNNANGASTNSTPNRQNSNNSTSSSTSASRSRPRNSSDGNMVKCNFCPRKISTSMVDAHRNECRMIRCHECPQCGKRFKARGGLQQHSRIHLQERAYGCKFCPKRFTQKSHLDQHERIHTGAKPFVCQFCGRGFRQRSQQIGHEATHPAGAVAATTTSLNSTNSSGIFSINTTASDQSSISDNSCDASPASSTLPMQMQQHQQQQQNDHQQKVLLQQMTHNHNNAVMLNMLNNSTPTNNSQLLNLITN